VTIGADDVPGVALLPAVAVLVALVAVPAFALLEVFAVLVAVDAPLSAPVCADAGSPAFAAAVVLDVVGRPPRRRRCACEGVLARVTMDSATATQHHLECDSIMD
jgi:hypothetical protein